AMGTPVSGPPIWFVARGTAPNLLSRCSLHLEDGTDLGDIYSLPQDLPIGYHRLSPVDGGPPTLLVVHPEDCRTVPRKWGVAAHIDSLWSARSGGIGDSPDLAPLATRLRDAGGEAILLSPLYQPAPALPQENSPYYPSSRRARSALLLGCDDPPPHAL